MQTIIEENMLMKMTQCKQNVNSPKIGFIFHQHYIINIIIIV